MTIRRYEEEDSAACRGLWAELTRWHRALYDDPSIGGDDPGSGFDRLAGERIWVAERRGSVVGFVGLVIRGRQAEIEPVVVSFDVRGQGIGRSLVETAVEDAGSDRPVGPDEQRVVVATTTPRAARRAKSARQGSPAC